MQLLLRVCLRLPEPARLSARFIRAGLFAHERLRLLALCGRAQNAALRLYRLAQAFYSTMCCDETKRQQRGCTSRATAPQVQPGQQQRPPLQQQGGKPPDPFGSQRPAAPQVQGDHSADYGGEAGGDADARRHLPANESLPE